MKQLSILLGKAVLLAGPRRPRRLSVLLLAMMWCLAMSAQNGIVVKGIVFDSTGETLIGASVVVKGH
jgi:hypothetical protein